MGIIFTPKDFLVNWESKYYICEKVNVFISLILHLLYGNFKIFIILLLNYIISRFSFIKPYITWD